MSTGSIGRVGVVLLLAVGALVAQGQQLPRVTVTCVDSDGKPVVDAEVHLFQFRRGTPEPEHSGPHRTGADGSAATAIAIDYDGGCFDRWLYARVEGRLVGALRWARFGAGAPPMPEQPVIRMEASRELRGVVQVPEGVDVTTVRVRTMTLRATSDADAFGVAFPRVDSIDGLRRTLPEHFDAAVRADGGFVLRDLPPRPMLYLAAEGPGLAQAQWCNVSQPRGRLPELVEIAMARESVVIANVRDAGRSPVVGALVKLRITAFAFGVQCTFEGRVDAGGRVRIGGLPATEFAVEVEHPERVIRPLPLRLVAGDDPTELTLTMATAIEVRGVVRRAGDKAGVERVGISAITDDEPRWRLGHAMTDPQGRFVLRLPPGATALYVSSVPSGFEPPPSSDAGLVHVEVAKDNDELTKIEFEIVPSPTKR
jgi:hypothetical protein